MNDVIDLDDVRRQPEATVVTTETPLTVLGRDFTIRRTVYTDTGRGWFTVRDDAGNVLFLRMADFPRERIGDLVMAWLDGAAVGHRDALAKPRPQPSGGDLL